MLIREKDRQSVIAIAKASIKEKISIWAFGSRVNGDAHDTSDLDLVIKTSDNSSVDIDEFMNFKESLRDSNIPIIVQVMDWNRMPESFHKQILKKYTVLV